VLLAKLAGDMKASMAKAAAVFNALPAQMAQLAEALRAKREAEGGAAADETGPAADDAATDTPAGDATEAPAAEAPAAEAPAAEAPAVDAATE
jgi:large subunit ribosomal protein L10